MNWQIAFPDFPAADLPADLPPGFKDASWRNDACPKFHNAESGVTIWIDYSDISKREIQKTGARYIIEFERVSNEATRFVEADTWLDVLTTLERAPCL